MNGEGVILDLDKSWHAIHYLLSGSVRDGSGPEAFLLAGGNEIGDVDVGVGPAQALTSAETCQVAAAIERIPTEKLAARFDAAELHAADIYPPCWVHEDAEGFSYVSDYYEALRSFVATASRNKMGILVAIT